MLRRGTKDKSRRLLRVTVVEADLSGLGPVDSCVSAALYRVHDDKEIANEKDTSHVVKNNPKPTFRFAVATSVLLWCRCGAGCCCLPPLLERGKKQQGLRVMEWVPPPRDSFPDGNRSGEEWASGHSTCERFPLALSNLSPHSRLRLVVGIGEAGAHLSCPCSPGPGNGPPPHPDLLAC